MTLLDANQNGHLLDLSYTLGQDRFQLQTLACLAQKGRPGLWTSEGITLGGSSGNDSIQGEVAQISNIETADWQVILIERT